MAYLRKPDGQKRGKEKIVTDSPPKLAEKTIMPTIHHQPSNNTEDKASHDRHIKYIQRECKSSRPKKKVITPIKFVMM